MIAFGHAARDLQINRLIVACVGVFRDDLVHESGPLGVAERIGEAYAVEAVLQAPQMLGQAEGVA